MDKTIVHSVPDFVEVSYRPDLEAVHLKWFSEYELLGNWATYRNKITLQEQCRFEYDALYKIGNFGKEHNAVCDAVPDLSLSMQMDWGTLEIPNFYTCLEQVQQCISRNS